MKEIDIAAVHNAELSILKAVDTLCEKHGIRYSLYCGTLLGAVRHHGFIPWDNDIDLAMPLKDYRRFLRIAEELPDAYVCSHYGNTRDFFFPWARVTSSGTTCMDPQLASLDIPMGLFVDIYPFIGEAKTRWGFLLQSKLLVVARRLRTVALYRARNDGGVVKKILYGIPFPVRKAVSDCMLFFAMRDPEKAERIGTIDSAPFSGKFAREDWQEMTRLRFEDGEFPAPAKYDGILRRMYGNYMQLPPVEQRTIRNKDNLEAIIDPHRDYQEYRKEFLNRNNRC